MFDNFVICGVMLENCINFCFNGLMLIFVFMVMLFEDKECVEVFKGVLVLYYGYMMLGGVVNFVMKCVGNMFVIMLGMQFDSNGIVVGMFDVGCCFGEDN